MKIAYKVVAAALAIAIIVAMIFVPVVYIRAKSIAAQALVYLSQMKDSEAANEIIEKNGGNIPEHMALDVSVYSLFTEYADFLDLIDESDDSSSAVEKLEKLISPAVTFLISFALIAVCAVLTAVFAIGAKDNRKVIFSSMAGIGMSFMVKYSFEIIAEPFLTGEITIASLIESFWGYLIGDIDTFTLDDSFWFIPAIFAVIILWTVLYNATLPEKEKLARKAMLGEEAVEVIK